MTNSIRFEHYGFNCVNFQEKEAKCINNIIRNARVGAYMQFEAFTNISFANADEYHKEGNLNTQETFNKKLTNGLLYNIKHDLYNKCLVYRASFAKGNDEYSYILYNTENDNKMQKSMIADSINELIISLGLTIIR